MTEHPGSLDTGGNLGNSHLPAARKNTSTKASKKWRRLMFSASQDASSPAPAVEENEGYRAKPDKWSLGVLNDKVTDEVPGSVLLMSNTTRNEPLGLRNAPARTSASSLPSPFPPASRSSTAKSSMRRKPMKEKKRTADGKIILEPQPEDTLNDPLNWPSWRRDVALLSLGFYCMVGGGMTPVLAAGFQNVATTYNVSIPQVALTTGLYMLGLGLGSVIASPTAIIWGKRPVYLAGILLFIVSAIWCAASPDYPSLVIARIFMGIAVSPCECLPSATIAEIFYLHERAYRLGIYTLLLLSGKNLLPLVSAVIIQSLGWRWVFWIIALVVGFCFVLMLLFVPETFWDRTPRPHQNRKQTLASWSRIFHHVTEKQSHIDLEKSEGDGEQALADPSHPQTHMSPSIPETRRQGKVSHHVGFVDPASSAESMTGVDDPSYGSSFPDASVGKAADDNTRYQTSGQENSKPSVAHESAAKPISSPVSQGVENLLHLRQSRADCAQGERVDVGYFNHQPQAGSLAPSTPHSVNTEHSKTSADETAPIPLEACGGQHYTAFLRSQPPKTYCQTLKPWNGKLRNEKWTLVAVRPFLLFAYPAILWSTLVYSLSIGWLIVLSEAVAEVYKSKDTYNFTSLQTGLVYISPFVGGILGTAVAGKVSDVIVRFMSRRNGGIYEPEFRLVMAIPVAIATCIGLMGFGWSAEERDNWIVPTIFFGVISFGCSLGSTTSITFAVDSYRQYAGEALVTLNFSKNIFHGLVFSLFFNHWLESEGVKKTFIAIGGIQLACLLSTIPMYIYGKRARMWTVRKNMMEKF